jgi:hypothetical protein
VHWLRAHIEPTRFETEFFSLLPGGAASALDERHSAKAAQMYIYDRPEIARVKYALNFLVVPTVVDEITSEMLAERGIDEGDLCERLYMDERELRRLAEDGQVVGVHGHTHLPFSRLSDDELMKDVRENVAFIERATGVRPTWVSYPYGREDAIPPDGALAALFTGLQLQLGLTLTGSWNEWPPDPRRLYRINTNDVAVVLPQLMRQEGRHHAG